MPTWQSIFAVFLEYCGFQKKLWYYILWDVWMKQILRFKIPWYLSYCGFGWWRCACAGCVGVVAGVWRGIADAWPCGVGMPGAAAGPSRGAKGGAFPLGSSVGVAADLG